MFRHMSEKGALSEKYVFSMWTAVFSRQLLEFIATWKKVAESERSGSNLKEWFLYYPNSIVDYRKMMTI